MYSGIIQQEQTPWSRVFLQNMTVAQLVKKFASFYRTRRLIHYRLHKSSPLNPGHTLLLQNLYIALPSTPRSCKWSFLLKFLYLCIYLPMRATCPTSYITCLHLCHAPSRRCRLPLGTSFSGLVYVKTFCHLLVLPHFFQECLKPKRPCHVTPFPL
jgi:hypothetical protein